MPSMVTPPGKRLRVAGQNRIAETSALIITAPINTAAGLPRATLTNKIPRIAPNTEIPPSTWINDGSGISRKRQQPCQDRADQTNSVGFENVRSHACAIAYVVSHIIGDYRG